MIIPIRKLVIIKYAISGIIAPHGITDIIHAKQHHLIPQLCKINGITFISCVFLYKFKLNYILNNIFILSSIIHFRRDFPKTYIPRHLLSSIFIFSLLYYPNNFIFYMLFIHVPNHYILNWKYLINDKIYSIFIIFFTSIICIFIGNFLISNKLLIPNSFIFNFIKSIIISHIIYEECFIYNKQHKTNIIKNLSLSDEL